TRSDPRGIICFPYRAVWSSRVNKLERVVQRTKIDMRHMVAASSRIAIRTRRHDFDIDGGIPRRNRVKNRDTRHRRSRVDLALCLCQRAAHIFRGDTVAQYYFLRVHPCSSNGAQVVGSDATQLLKLDQGADLVCSFIQRQEAADKACTLLGNRIRTEINHCLVVFGIDVGTGSETHEGTQVTRRRTIGLKNEVRLSPTPSESTTCRKQ